MPLFLNPNRGSFNVKIHDNGFTPQSGECFWAAALPYGATAPIIMPVTFAGQAPYLEVRQTGTYHSELWLLERCELPSAEVERDANGIVLGVCLATHAATMALTEQPAAVSVGAEG